MSENMSENKAKILVVDDEVIIASDLESRLKALGYTVCAKATNGEQALDLVEQHQPDLVMMDIVLQGEMDGIDAAEVIRDKWVIPVVFLTAYADTDRLERAKLTYPFGYLIKPYRDKDLKVTVEMALYLAKVEGEKKRAEENLHYSLDFFRKTLNGFSANIAILNENGAIVHVNNSWRKFAEANGPVHSNVNEGANYLEVCDEAGGDCSAESSPFAAGIRDILNGLIDSFELEYPCHSPNEKRWFVGRARKYLYLDKNYVTVEHENITARKRAQDALRESEKKYRTLVESGLLGVVIAQANPVRLPFANQAIGSILGFEPEELTQMGPEEIAALVWEGDRQLFFDNFQKRLSGNDIPQEGEYRVICKDGSMKWVATYSSMIEFAGELSTLTSFLDITHRKKMEETLRQSGKQLSEAMKMSQTGHWEYDVASDTFTFNDNFYRIFRTTAEKVGGYQMSSAEYARRFCHPGDANLVAEEVQAVIQATDPQFTRQLEHRVLYADGEVGHITVRFFIVKDSQGRTVRTFGVNQDITKRKQTEEMLRESERKLNLALKVAKMGYWWIDCNTYKVEWSLGHDSLFGIPMEDFGGTLDAVQECVHPEDREHGIENLKKALEDDIPFDNTYRVVHPDGDVRWLHSYGHVGRDRHGKPETIFGITQDITERLQAEEAIRRSEKRNRVILHTATDGFCRMDLRGRLLEVNDSYCRMSGYSEGELLGMSISDLEVDDSSEKIQARLAKTVEVGQARFISRHRRKDGSILDVEISAQHYPDEGGASVAFIRDISEKRKAESQLRFHAALAEQVSDAIIATDLDLKITSWNSAAEQIYGWPAHEVRGRHIDELLQTEWFDQKFEEAQRVLADTGFWRGKVHQRSRVGRTLVIEASVSWINDGTGTIVGGVTVNRDITEREKALRSAEISEARYRSIVSALPDLLFRIDAELRFIDVQTSMPEMLLAPAEEIIGKMAWEILPNDIAELTDQKIRATLKSGDMQVYHYALDIRGHTRECETRMVPCGDNEVLAIVRDVTESREAERSLQESEARYNAVVNDQTDLVCRFNTDGILTFVNASYCVYFGCQADDLIGRSFYSFIPEKDRAFVEGKFWSLTWDQPVITYEHEVIDGDGHIRWMEWTDRAIFNYQGDISAYQAVGRDITERKILRQNLVSASEREQLKLAQELHDGLCQDLKGLELQAALLENIVKENFTAVKDQARSLSSGINLAVRRAYDITQGMFPIDLTTTNFCEALAMLIQRTEYPTAIRLTAAIEDTLSPKTQTQAHQLYRIAQEALNNALRHSKATKITLGWRKENGEMKLSIKDNGVGVENKNQDGSQGMGLHVMSSRAEAISASLIVQNLKNGGTEVTVRLRDE